MYFATTVSVRTVTKMIKTSAANRESVRDKQWTRKRAEGGVGLVWRRRLRLLLDVGQDADAVGGARSGTRAADEDDGLVRLEQIVLVAETHRELQPVVNVLLPLRRLRLCTRPTHGGNYRGLKGFDPHPSSLCQPPLIFCPFCWGSTVTPQFFTVWNTSVLMFLFFTVFTHYSSLQQLFSF